MSHPPASLFRRTLLLTTTLSLSLLGSGGAVQAAAYFNAVAAGDMSASDAILWTRSDNGGATTNLTAQVATDAAFGSIVWSGAGSTVAANDYTLKLAATGLAGNTQYFYRFTDGTTASQIGRFTTTPAANQNVNYKIGFTGDADGNFRPFPSMNNFGTAANPGSVGLNSFIFLGDTMYETGSPGSPAVPLITPTSTPAQSATGLVVYETKYLQNISGVTTGGVASAAGQQGLSSFLAAQGTYTLLDNHELSNKQLQSGGAPLAAASPNSNQAFDANTTGSYNNQTVGFLTTEKSFLNYHPTTADIQGTPVGGLTISGPTVNAPGDARSNGTAINYLVRSWGKNAQYIQLDDRSYRDVRLNVSGGPRAADPNRTMLGATQLAWFKAALSAAQTAGTTWKVVSVSTPIDQTGGNQDTKSWAGGFQAERNDILKYIVDNHIDHVVFLTTDDHQMRTTALQYEPDPISHSGVFAPVPGAFQVLTGPLGAFGPDAVTDHSFANIQALLNNPATGVINNPDLIAHGDPVVGLVGFKGLSNVVRAGDSNAATNPTSVDFYAPDQFGYTTLDFDIYGNLRVEDYGINSYKADCYTDAVCAAAIANQVPSLVMGFSIDVPEPGSMALLATGLFGLIGVVRRRS